MSPFEEEELEVDVGGVTSKNFGWIVAGAGMLVLVVLGVSLIIIDKK
tara:strand:+ start:7645 stop:7785 length:141 start_codon:yes stop_codon:yes gene_type:complete